MRFYCCLWRFSTPVVAPLRDRIVSAESDIFKLKNTPTEKPTSFTSRFFCIQVDVSGLRCDVTRKPFHMTFSKEKQSKAYLQVKILRCQIPLHSQIKEIE